MAQMTGLNYKIQEMAHRIRELREIENFTIAEMANKTGVTEQEYIDCEMGRSDLNFAFLYRCALAFGVDVGDIIEGSSPLPEPDRRAPVRAGGLQRRDGKGGYQTDDP